MLNFLNKKRKMGKKGFTLIELIVVIAIIGILVLLAAPKFLGYTKDANTAAMKADAKVLSNAALMHNIDNEAWPIADAATPVDLLNAGGLESLTAVGGALEGVSMFALDEAKLGSYVKNTANPISDYVLVTSGDFEGEVFHLGGVEDSKQVTWFGVAQ